MAAKTGNGDSWQPMTGAGKERIEHLGALLRLRRAALGYRHVPQFVRDQGINTKMVGDIEHGRRDTYTFPSLEDVARAYGVTYGSIMDVVWSGADELTAAPAILADAREPEPPFDLARAASDRPWFDEINERRVALAAEGIRNPTGAQMFGEGTDDARAWDYYGASLDVGKRVWLIADLRRRAAAREADPAANSHSALRRGNVAGRAAYVRFARDDRRGFRMHPA